jgi:hypothetical protein
MLICPETIAAVYLQRKSNIHWNLELIQLYMIIIRHKSRITFILRVEIFNHVYRISKYYLDTIFYSMLLSPPFFIWIEVIDVSTAN